MRGSAACASPSSVIFDDLPPYTWGGPTACADWWNAFAAANKQNDMSWGTLVPGQGMARRSDGQSRVYRVSGNLLL